VSQAGEPSRSPRPASGSELKRVLDAERAGSTFLLYRDEHGAHRLTVLPETRPVTIGRRPANDVALGWDPQVSRTHAAIECLGGEWTVADDGLSRNGTFVNGTRIGGRTRLRDGDALRCGSTALLFRTPAEASLTATAGPPAALTAVDTLTDSQRRVLLALCRPYKHSLGYTAPATNQQIADEVFLSVDAVKTHLRILFQKFGLQDLPRTQKRARLVECAFQWGLVSERDL
jgi:pSer/pThr/pTyr-binding forkhead associated (FHA) protein